MCVFRLRYENFLGPSLARGEGAIAPLATPVDPPLNNFVHGDTESHLRSAGCPNGPEQVRPLHKTHCQRLKSSNIVQFYVHGYFNAVLS